jgi:hypothetical protein
MATVVLSCWARVGDDVVELRGRLVVDRGPRAAAVERDVGAAVVALDHPARVVGRDPQVVVVAVRHRDRGEGLPPVERAVEAGVEDVE